MNKITRIVICTGLLLQAFYYDAQRKVENFSYDIMLGTLLSHSVNEISVAEIPLEEKIVYLDTREKSEYVVSHIKGAFWVGYDDFTITRVDKIKRKERVVVYCSVGYRSEKIAEKLLELGFADVSNLYGGIFEWKNQGYPLFNLEGKTNDIHPYSRVWGVWLTEGNKVYR